MTVRISNKDTHIDFLKVFKLFGDKNYRGISLRNFPRVIKDLGKTMTDKQFLEMINRAF